MIHPSKRLGLLFLAMLPALITSALAITCLITKHISGLDRFMPMLPIIPIFYWGMVQARDMPYWFVFMLGVVIDSVTGLPLGVSSLTYILFLIILHTQRKYIHKEVFVIKWGFFAGILAIADIFNLVLLASFYSYINPLGPVFLQWFLTVCCYPLMHKIFDGIYEYIQSRRWQLLHGR